MTSGVLSRIAAQFTTVQRTTWQVFSSNRTYLNFTATCNNPTRPTVNLLHSKETHTVPEQPKTPHSRERLPNEGFRKNKPNWNVGCIDIWLIWNIKLSEFAIMISWLLPTFENGLFILPSRVSVYSREWGAQGWCVGSTSSRSSTSRSTCKQVQVQ